MTAGPDREATMMRRFTLKGLVNAALVTLCAVAVSACGDDDSGLTFTPPPRVVVLSAFPAEMAPLLAQTTIHDTMMIAGHKFRIGVLGAIPVVVGLTGIGLANAAMTTHAVLEQFTVAGVVFSGVANSTHPIGSVVV